MAIPYNKLYETASKLKKAGLEGVKSTRDATRQMAIAAKQSETVKSAGPALGKVARYAAYPAGIGLGVGAGGYFAGMGIGGGVGGVKDAMMPKDEKEGGILRTLISIAMLLLLAYGVVRLYTMVKAAG
jgi:hypothetical protein